MREGYADLGDASCAGRGYGLVARVLHVAYGAAGGQQAEQP
jgi:hypothetical protein